MKMIKTDEGGKQEINTENYLKNKKIKRESKEKADTTICLKKNNKY